MSSPLRPVLLALCVALPGAAAAAADGAAFTAVYQQRLADGRIVLTDRPSASAVTERTWQVEREDPAAARQRALDVKLELQAVTERIQRGIDLEQRRAADADLQRWRLARLDLDRESEAARDAGSDAVVLFAPRPNRFRSLKHMHDRPGRSHASPRAPFRSGSFGRR